VKAVTIPGLFTGLRRPDLTLFFVVVVAIILLTAGLFGYINRLGVDFGKTVLVLAAGYNILIGLVKLGLAPAALHEANQKLAFDASVADPNSTWFYLAVSSGISFLYLLVFRVMYGIFKRRFRRRAGEIGGAPERRSRTGEWSGAVPTLASSSTRSTRPRYS
jgi:hypothetical protein